MKLTLDSSVIIAALRKQEVLHKPCLLLLQQVSEGKHTALESDIVLVEVTAAIRRRTGSRKLAREVRENLVQLDFLFFLEVTESRMFSATKIAERFSLKGMDAIIAQIAQEKDSVLVTLDKEFAKKVTKLVSVEEIEKVLAVSK